jgi:hypothetical protein
MYTNVLTEIQNICKDNNVGCNILDNITPNCKSFKTSITSITENIDKIKTINVLSVEPVSGTLIDNDNFILRCEVEYVNTK